MSLSRRSPISRRAPKRNGPRNDSAYLAFVRGLPCSAGDLGPCAGRIDPHHAGTNKGVGLKADDRTAIPLCRRHHDELHTLRGPFRGWDKATRRDWSANAIAAVQLMATPEDLGQARDFEAIGLGRLVCQDGVWSWVRRPGLEAA